LGHGAWLKAQVVQHLLSKPGSTLPPKNLFLVITSDALSNQHKLKIGACVLIQVTFDGV
jgi:hypothetical protein